MPTAKGPDENDTCRDYVLPALLGADWQRQQILEQVVFADGRIIPTAGRPRRGDDKRADYLLEVEPGVPVAVVEAKRLYRRPGDGLQQAMEYAEILNLSLAYSSNGKGIVEHDYDSGLESRLTEFPPPIDMWRRHRAARGIVDDEVAEGLLLPFNRDLRNTDGSVKEPRYYQRIAIDRALQAILSNRPRLLLTMATGTGKTFTAMQIVWKLWNGSWRSDRHPRVLYLADRNILVDQPITREFQPVFGDAVWKISGSPRTGREIYFALYQALGDSGDNLGIFRDYPPDYFDLVIVDECHRGSARDDSSWRGILEHFEPAIQLGMTATPQRSENINTYRYFGAPIYSYSLKQGIDDGFLAPFMVRKRMLSTDVEGWRPTKGQLDLYGREIPEGLYPPETFERVVALLMRTRAAAVDLTNYLKATDRWAKTIVFCRDADHADQMRIELNNANADLTRQFPHYVARIVSAEGEHKDEHLDNFVDPEKETPVIAVTSKLLSTGVDIPNCKNIVLFRPIGSMVEFKQIIGRGTRLYPEDEKFTFTIIDYTRATELFNDPQFDGDPEFVTDAEIDDEGNITKEEEVTEGELPSEEDEDLPNDIEREPFEKYYVDEGEVYVTAEAVFMPDPDDGTLRAIAYADYTGEQVRRLYPHMNDLRGRWRTKEGRDAVVDELELRGISIDELRRHLANEEADAFDLLISVAWNAPAIPRRERASKVRSEYTDFLNSFRPQAKDVLDALLDKYSDYGIEQVDDLRVLEIQPFSEFGSVVEIAEFFGGPDDIQQALSKLGTFIYDVG